MSESPDIPKRLDGYCKTACGGDRARRKKCRENTMCREVQRIVMHERLGQGLLRDCGICSGTGEHPAPTPEQPYRMVRCKCRKQNAPIVGRERTHQQEVRHV